MAMRESMGPKKIALIVAAIVIIVIAGGIVASGSLTKHDDRTEQTYEYTCNGIKPTGILVDDEGNEVIRISTWKGDPNSLYTTWGLRDQYAPVPFDDVQWLQYIVKIHADPGTTVSLEQVSFCVKPNLTIITDDGIDPANYHTSAFMMYAGQKIHSSLCSSSVTTDFSGYAEMIIIVLTDQWHRHVEIDGDWTCTSRSS